MSCVYGPRQFGTEDPGWVAHFLIRALRGEPITMYGDGRQVRDLLFVDDLVDAMLLALQNIDRVSGQVYNMGCDAHNTTSLRELIALISELTYSRHCRLHGRHGWRDRPMPANVRSVGHVHTRDHNACTRAPLAVLDSNRVSMARDGLSPPTRVFETAAYRRRFVHHTYAHRAVRRERAPAGTNPPLAQETAT